MALRPDFDPVKFREQARLHACRIGKQNEAEDFAQFAVLQVLHYQHFQPWKWLVATYFKSNNPKAWSEKTYQVKNPISLDSPTENEELNLLDILEVKPSIQKQFEPSDLFFNKMARASSANLRSALSKTGHFYTQEFKEYVDCLDPLEMEWICF